MPKCDFNKVSLQSSSEKLLHSEILKILHFTFIAPFTEEVNLSQTETFVS